jgi:tetratricopeptide (TPR) repeat protein/TolB-like protein/predicted Ser/Thr protein kinase
MHTRNIVLVTGNTFGHYQVLEKVGAGGMGEVYRARDLHLERDVALKILPAGLLGDEAARKQFRQEALVLSKLNHPNIATVFDFDTWDGRDFLAMELIHGVSLSERVKTGPLPEQETLRLGTQLAEGLSAAHAQGVIHRDLKPGNLMIMPDGRLKILDFGLAILTRPESDPDLTRTMGESEVVTGTIPYMPPEQLRGQRGDARSDIYAAGAVLYEMATGEMPFPQSQSAELIGAILHQSPRPAYTLNSSITSELESVVMKCLEKEPASRYQSARELLDALEGKSTGIAALRPKHWRIARAIAATVLVLTAGLAIGLNLGRLRDAVFGGAAKKEEIGTPIAPIRVRRSVAILGFKNLSGRSDEAWLSTALSEMLTTELAAGEHLRTIPGESIAQMKINLSLSDADSYGKETLFKIRSNLQTDSVVLGSFIPLNKGEIRLDLRLQDTVTGETLAAVSERGGETQIDDLITRAGSALRQKLGAGEVSESQASAVRATRASNAEASRLYSEGLVKLRAFDALAARDLLEKAVAADPKYSVAHLALSTAWSTLGYDEKAKTEAQRAFELSGELSREERLLVEARYRVMTGERERAVDIYRTLWGFFPDNLDYGLQLASAQTAAGKGRDALTTVEAIRKLSPPAGTDPRIDLAEAGAASSLSDYKREQAAAERAEARGSAQGARLLVARAQLSEGAALHALGDLVQATARYESAKGVFAAAGDRWGVASALSNIAFVSSQRGEPSKAEEMNQQALAIRRKIGDKQGVAQSLNSLAMIRYNQRDVAAAKKFFEQSLSIRREIGDRRGVATALSNLGAALFLQGNLAAAKKMFEDSLAIQRDVGDKSGVAIALNNIAQVLGAQADLAGAKRTYEEALVIRRELGEKSGVASTVRNLGEILQKQGDLSEAEKKLEEALTIRTETGEKTQAASVRIPLADVLVYAGQAARAETLARAAVDEFRAEKAATREAFALNVLAKSLLAQMKLDEARKTIDLGTNLVAKSELREARLALRTTAARVHVALGETASATKMLDGVLAEATKFRLVEPQLEARLALGQIEMQSGKAAAGRARLTTVEKEAAAQGLLLISRNAHSAANSQ